MTEFSIDHQRTVFDENFKIISLKNAESYNGVYLKSTFCNGTDIPNHISYMYTHSTSIKIPTDSTVYNNKSVYFRLCAWDIVSGTCQNQVPDFIIQKNGKV